MSWRLSPLYISRVSTIAPIKVPSNAFIRRSNIPVALFLSTISFSRRKLHGITPSASLQVAQPADSSKTEEWPINDGLVIGRKATDNCTVHPTQNWLLHTTCADLLTPKQDAWDQATDSVSQVSQASPDKRVSVTGMIKSIRKQKRSAFAQFTDGSCFEAIQIVFEPRLALPCVSHTI
jgi:hypothetical protein